MAHTHINRACILRTAMRLILLKLIAVVPSVLWRCWLGGRKGIWPVKNWVVGYWHGYLTGAKYRLAYGPADATATHWAVKSRLVLPFWYPLTQVVLEKNGWMVVVIADRTTDSDQERSPRWPPHRRSRVFSPARRRLVRLSAGSTPVQTRYVPSI